MRRFRLLALGLAVAVGSVLLGTTGASAQHPGAQQPGAQQPETQQRCALPGTGAPRTADPQRVGLDPAAVRAAIGYASTHLRSTVKIFRNNCLLAQGPLDPVTDRVPYNVWSSTKSVVSLLTGMAAARGKLTLDDAIDRHLPTGTGWGDAAHRAITVRQLLTETAGLDEAILSEAATLSTDPHVAREALAQPLTHRPGTKFAYSQRAPDLLAFVVQRALGEDLQEFAQRQLFAPVGIPRDSYFWLRDRSGNSYGYANLFIAPAQFAKLGLLMQNDGVWRGERLVPADYVQRLRRPSRTNGCYGYLFWVNSGSPCIGANIPNAQTVRHRMIPSAPPDTYAMVGALQQNNFVIPSLRMTVTWTGVLGDTTPNLTGLTSAHPAASDLYHNFFRILMRGVRDVDVPDPGPYRSPPLDLNVDPTNYADPRVLLRDLAPSANCNVLVCGGTVPTTGLFRNGEAIGRALLGLARGG